MRRAVAIAIVGAGVAGGCGGSAAAPTRPAHVTPTGVAFWDLRHGLVVTAQGVVEATDDGGRRWTLRVRLREPLATVAIAPGGRAWVTAGRPGVLRSDDRGRTWSRVAGAVRLPVFASPTQGWALAAEGRARAMATADAGRTWRAAGVPCRGVAATAAAIAAISPSTAEALCVSDNPATNMEAKALSRTTDSGRTWTVIDATALPGRPATRPAHGLPLVGVLPGMVITPDLRGWLWADRGALYRTDDGEHWRPAGRVLESDVATFAAADLVTRTAGYALLVRAGATRLIRTRDGGSTWTVVHTWPS